MYQFCAHPKRDWQADSLLGSQSICDMGFGFPTLGDSSLEPWPYLPHLGVPSLSFQWFYCSPLSASSRTPPQNKPSSLPLYLLFIALKLAGWSWLLLWMIIIALKLVPFWNFLIKHDIKDHVPKLIKIYLFFFFGEK